MAPHGYGPFRDWTVTVPDRGCAKVIWLTRVDGHIRGHLYSSDGTPAAGIYLTTKIADSDPDKLRNWQPSYSTTAADGSFDLAELPAGSHIFVANMDFAPQDGKPYYIIGERSFPA